jgi:transcriptional regulator with XRE-family HTH domain
MTDIEEQRRIIEGMETLIRTRAKGLLAGAGVSQSKLAAMLGVSQSSVSHMLTNRAYGLTATEVNLIELACKVPDGTIYRSAGLVVDPQIEDLVWELPGITEQTARALLAAIAAVRADAARPGGQR